ncbi:hypothetical protein ISN76_11245 [Dyella halodurans]|uniref:Uncharacterized protein n=1 Tax=Dyella halodurans TaxID=1920171 RepID=A0ABV9C321_9GAMM|nr:hypothetical protein [Dyella halodurans]
MLKEVELLCSALDEFASSIRSSIPNDNPLSITYGWIAPALSRADLASIPSQLADALREKNPQEIDASLLARISMVPSELKQFQVNTLPMIANGNVQGAIAPLMATIFGLRTIIEPLVGWQKLDRTELPVELARRVRTANATLNNLMPSLDALKGHVELIDRARVTADEMPLAIEEVNELREQVRGNVEFAKKLADESLAKNVQVEQVVASLTEHEGRAAQIVSKCEEAYRITTTKGLAQSFSKKALEMQISLYVWVALLLVALGIGAGVGAHRFNVISEFLSKPNVNLQLLWVHLGLAVISVGAPIWFAWLATKQIAQRFKIAEDYAFKASVAMAYEGYRKEAISLDEKFQAELFASALKRLDEAPIRLVDQANHGSPWSELLASPAIGKALDAAPDLKDRIFGLANLAVERLAGGTKAGAKQVAESASTPTVE